jgi:hypothetical protein
MFGVHEAVASLECTLPSRSRLLVHVLAFVAYGREEPTIQRLAEYAGMRPRATRKYLAMVASACGDDPVIFVRDVVNGRRPVAEWLRALELHGGRHGA